MSIDKNWIKLRDHFSNEHWKGSKEFIERAKNIVNDQGLVRCPCKKCSNMLHQQIETIEDHIVDNGFSPFLYQMDIPWGS